MKHKLSAEITSFQLKVVSDEYARQAMWNSVAELNHVMRRNVLDKLVLTVRLTTAVDAKQG